MRYWKKEYEFYNERDMQLILLQRSYLINSAFKMCGEEFELYHNGIYKIWDLVAIDETFIYLIELKVKKAKSEDLIKMELIAEETKSYKPVKILLVTPVITARQKKNISKYKQIEHIEIEEIKHNPNMPKPAKRKNMQVENRELKMFELLQYIKYDYFNYYRGYETIENYYTCLYFKFNNNLGITFRYHIQNDFFDYELVKYITQTYSQTLKTFYRIDYMKFNMIFDKVLSYADIKRSEKLATQTEIDKLIEELGKIDNMRKYDTLRIFNLKLDKKD
jgi:hypothetical protein